MFVRQKPNRSGSVSVQVIDKSNGYRVVKTIGSAREPEKINRLVELGELFIARQSRQYSLFPADQHDSAVILDFVQTLENAAIRTVGPELIFGRLFDEIGFGVIPEELFRDIVVARLVYPTSKLKTVDYLHRYRGKTVSAQSIYRFLDRLNGQYSRQAQEAAYQHSRKILGRIQVVFYDMTSLYFEAEDVPMLNSGVASGASPWKKPMAPMSPEGATDAGGGALAVADCRPSGALGVSRRPGPGADAPG